MDMQETTRIGAEISRARREGTAVSLVAHGALTLQEADAIQSFALPAFADDYKGYAVSEASLFGLEGAVPLLSPIADQSLFANGTEVRLVPGTLGALCGLTVAFGAGGLEDSPLSCLTVAASITIYGRRVHGPLTWPIAIADFGLHVATVVGSPTFEIDWANVPSAPIDVTINGATMPMVPYSNLGRALDLLQEQMGRTGRQISPGSIAFLGLWKPMLQVLPGQKLAVSIEGIGNVSCSFI